MILDMRCRVTTPSSAHYFKDILSKIGRIDSFNALKNDSIETFLNEMDEAGITTAVSVSGNNPGGQFGRFFQPPRTTSNEELAKLQEKYYGKIIGVGGIDAGNIYHNSLDEIQKCFDLGLRAIFIEPGRSPGCLLNDHILYPIYEKCQKLNLSLIPQTSGLLGGKNIDYANPRYIEEIAEDFPELRIICGHGCYPYVREMIMVCQRRDNIWASPDLYLLKGLGKQDWIDAVNNNLFDFSDKFIFGSAYPFMQMSDAVQGYKEINWNQDVQDKIFYKNALKALNLENDEIFKQLYNL